MVVSKICALREKAASALPMTKGARVMLSTPPAIIRSVSPARMARAAEPTASMPEPHSRLIVAPGTSSGRPASSRHARDVAVVLAGLVGAAVEDVVERAPVEVGMAQHQRPDGQSGEIVGSDRGERAAVAADGGAYGVADEGFVQFILLAS
jgi:hypothetical protein